MIAVLGVGKFIAAQHSDEDADGNVLLDICMSLVCV